MQKKHSFSPNHKVVTDSPHNFHPHGAPSTASMGAPPSQVGGGPAGAQGGGMDAGGGPSANFCNGGMKYADGGDVLGGGIRGKMADYGSALKDTWNQMTTTAPKASQDADPVKDAQVHATQNREKGVMDTVRKAETGEE